MAETKHNNSNSNYSFDDIFDFDAGVVWSYILKAIYALAVIICIIFSVGKCGKYALDFDNTLGLPHHRYNYNYNYDYQD